MDNIAPAAIVAAGNIALMQQNTDAVATNLNAFPQVLEDYLVQYSVIQEFGKLAPERQYPYIAQILIRDYTNRANLAFSNHQSAAGDAILIDLQRVLTHVKSLINNTPA